MKSLPLFFTLLASAPASAATLYTCTAAPGRHEFTDGPVKLVLSEASPENVVSRPSVRAMPIPRLALLELPAQRTTQRASAVAATYVSSISFSFATEEIRFSDPILSPDGEAAFTLSTRQSCGRGGCLDSAVVTNGQLVRPKQVPVRFTCQSQLF